MNEIPLSKKLKELMKQHGNLSVSELARLTQIPQPTLHHMLSGTTKTPRKKALESLANFFTLSVNVLLNDEDLPTHFTAPLKIKTIPIIEWDMLKLVQQQAELKTATKEVIFDNQDNQHAFALVMNDTSMEPMLPVDSILIFNPERTPKDRDLVIVYLSQHDTFKFNRLFIDDNDLYLKINDLKSGAQFIKLNLDEDSVIATLTEARLAF